MLLCHRPTGYAVFLGKRMGWGWYGVPDNLAETVADLFDALDGVAYLAEQDAFCLLQEESDEKWYYGEWINEAKTVKQIHFGEQPAQDVER